MSRRRHNASRSRRACGEALSEIAVSARKHSRASVQAKTGRHQTNGPGLGLDVANQTYSFQSSIGEGGGPSNS